MTDHGTTDLSGKRIVVVEDDFMLATDVCAELRKLGATVLGPAPTPFYAEQLLNSRHVDVAVLDIRLHGANVFEIADRVRSRGIRILFVTAADRDTLPKRFQDDAYLQKPVDYGQLMAKVHELTRFQPRPPQGRVASSAGQPGTLTPTLMFARTVARLLRRN